MVVMMFNISARGELTFPLNISLNPVRRNPTYSFRLTVLVTSFLFIFFNGVDASTSSSKVTRIGAIIDVSSRVGKEEKTALEIAVRNMNDSSENQKLSIYFRDPRGDPLQAAYAAEELINEQKVEVILGMNTWEEAGLVADVGSRAQVPVLSFAAPALTLPLTPRRWPFLIRMVSDGSEQIRCIAALVQSYSWRRVVVIYEDDVHGGESGNLALLSKVLQEVGSDIDYQLVLPPISSLSDPGEAIEEELIKLKNLVQSRVFIVLQSSLPMAAYLFGEATKTGLVSRDTAWIVGNKIADFLDSFETSVISSMEGALGIRTYYSTDDSSYKNFKAQFRRAFQLEYPEEDEYQPGIQALTAYDSIRIITEAIGRINSNTSSPNLLLDTMLSSNFTGLAGQVRFKSGELSRSPVLRTVNVIGKKYKELDFWLPSFGFSKTLVLPNGSDKNKSSGGLAGPVIWPGDLKEYQPKGWAMPTDLKRMRIVVPSRTSFERFVTFRDGKPEGFCIELFYKVLEHLNYSLPYEFVSHDGAYDEMIESVYNKTNDAAVGDITILAERTKYVEFTQPYLESGLSMIVPKDPEDSTWIFVRPFTSEMWIMSGVVFICTMLAVWMMEHPTNPDFRGPWKVQMGTALWFTFSSLFFAHREKINNFLTRVVLVVWFGVVLILTSSYEANLTSMLTVQRMQPRFLDIEYLKQNKLYVGCDDDSFIRTYLENVLHFQADKIKLFNRDNSYISEFQSKGIAAAFLEIPYERVFLNQYCKSYAATRATYRFGGFAFAFQKGSPYAADFSRAILDLSEEGRLRTLEEEWFAPSAECLTNSTDTSVGSLSIRSFWGLYIVSVATCAICFLVFLFRLVKRFRHDQEGGQENATPASSSLWNKIVELARYYHYNGQAINVPTRAPTFKQTPDFDERRSSRWEYVSTSDILDHPEASPSVEIVMLGSGNSTFGEEQGHV